jgi:hypothetical protein
MDGPAGRDRPRSTSRKAAAVTFEAWLDRLRTDGYLLCPASTAVPVELRAVRPDGWGVHLRCRGVRVRLGLYRPGRSAWQVPLWDTEAMPEDALELWEHRPLTPAGMPLPAGTRVAFTGAADTPDHEVVFDGARERGWRGHEAGLLAPAGAAALFAELMTTAEVELARWRPAAVLPVPAARLASTPAARRTAPAGYALDARR